MKTNWVNFKTVRETVDFRQVLEDYGVEFKSKGDQVQTFCPLPTHQGKRRSPSFSANLSKRIWQCFGCGCKGNVLDFVVRMEGLDIEDTASVRKAALLLQARYLTEAPEGSEAPRETIKPEVLDSKASWPRVVNAPLDFRLKGLDPNHPYLSQRKLSAETVSQFGLGHCNKGLMKGRIAIPLHDQDGQLIGYAGRLVDEHAIDEENPRYLFPGKREREGKIYEFQKSQFLFNAFRLQNPIDDLVVVEGFFSVMRLHQVGYRNTVALMGAACSEEQSRLITAMVKSEGRVWVMSDGDDAGGRCAQSAVMQIAPHRFVRWAKLPEGKQPEDLEAADLKTLLKGVLS